MKGTNTCQVAHSGVVIKGSMTVVMDDGSEMTYNGGDSFFIPAGHDGWVNGDEPMEAYEFAPIEKAGGIWNTEKKE